MKRQSFKTAFFALAFGLGLSSCQNNPTTLSKQIDRLKRQVVSDSVTLHQIKTFDYQNLKSDFIVCDSMLQYVAQDQIEVAFESLNLTQAYLHQFGQVQPIMSKKIRYALIQLDHLKADVESHYLTDSIALVYLNDESLIADTLHNQVVYFKDRFAQCQKDLNTFKKNHK